MVGLKMAAKKTRYSYMLRSWRNTLDHLAKETGTSLKEIAEYIGTAYSGGAPGFYSKMPRKRSTFIGIGMAFRQPACVINQWITDYARNSKDCNCRQEKDHQENQRADFKADILRTYPYI